MIEWWGWAAIGVVAIVGLAAVYVFIALFGSLRARSSSENETSYRLFRMLLAISRYRVKGRLAGQADDALSRAVRDAIRTGLLMFNVPARMVQGKEERVEVGIARSPDLHEELISGLRGQGEPAFEEISTSLYMEARLDGPTFEITPRSPAEQLIIPEPARWEFDVLPYRAGHRQITFFIAMRIEAEGIVGGRRRVSSLEKEIDVQVNISYATHRFVMNNWQWLIPAVLTLAGTVAAWLVVPF
jgi:hypothetical protein